MGPRCPSLFLIFNFVLGPPPPGGPGGGSGLQLSLGIRAFWVDFGPNPGGSLIFNFDFGLKRSWDYVTIAESSGEHI